MHTTIQRPSRRLQKLRARDKKAKRGEPVISARDFDENDIAAIKADVIDKVQHGPVVYPNPVSVVLPANEVNRITDFSTSNIFPDREPLDLPLIKQKKTGLSETEMKAELARDKARGKTDLEIEDDANNERIRKAARDKKLSEHEDIKAMKSIMAYAKCAAVREKQLAEKRDREERERVQDKKMDEMMEVERLNGIRKMEEEEQRRLIAQKKSAVMILKQLKQSKEKKQQELEEKRKEGQRMREIAQKQAIEEKEEKKRRMEESKRMMDACKLANKKMAEARQAQREKERLEQLKIDKYLADKEAREAAESAEKERQEMLKEKQRKKLRETQAKAQDLTAEIEELRMRRAQEADERKWRARQREEAEKQRRIQQELSQARNRQLLEKQLRLAEQATQERLEFEKNVKAFQDQQREIEGIEAGKVQKMKEYSEMLQTQIMDAESLPKLKEIDEMAEIQRKSAEERTMLEKVKAQYIAEMEESQIPVKYRQELLSYQILKPRIFN